MNSYTVKHQNISQRLKASDTDMAVHEAIMTSGISAANMGELLSITLHDDGQPDMVLLSHAGREAKLQLKGI